MKREIIIGLAGSAGVAACIGYIAKAVYKVAYEEGYEARGKEIVKCGEKVVKK